MRTPAAVRNKIRGAVRRGEIVKPELCEKCETKPPRPQLLLAHVPNHDAPFEIVWLCNFCYVAINPRSPDKVKRVPRKQVLKKAPPWKQMKLDYQSGYTFEELGRMWGLKSGKTGAFKVFKDRAVAHGEWPVSRENTVQVNAIFDLVKDHLRRTTVADSVWVTQLHAERFAPKCVINGKREYWGNRPPRFHQVYCPALIHLGNKGNGKLALNPKDDPRVFELHVEEALDWGYIPCPRCENGMTLATFAELNGFSQHLLYQIDSGRIRRVTFATARALLKAIGEPIAPSLWTPAERARSASSASPQPQAT